MYPGMLCAGGFTDQAPLRRQAVPFPPRCSHQISDRQPPPVGRIGDQPHGRENTYLNRLGNGKTMHVLVAASFVGFEVMSNGCGARRSRLDTSYADYGVRNNGLSYIRHLT